MLHLLLFLFIATLVSATPTFKAPTYNALIGGNRNALEATLEWDSTVVRFKVCGSNALNILGVRINRSLDPLAIVVPSLSTSRYWNSTTECKQAVIATGNTVTNVTSIDLIDDRGVSYVTLFKDAVHEIDNIHESTTPTIVLPPEITSSYMISTDNSNTSVALNFSSLPPRPLDRVNVFFYTNNTLTTCVRNVSVSNGVYTNSYLNNATDGYRIQALSSDGSGLEGPLSVMFAAPSVEWIDDPSADIWMEFDCDLFNWWTGNTTAYTQNATLYYRRAFSVDEYRLGAHLSSVSSNDYIHVPGSSLSNSSSSWSIAFMTYNNTLDMMWGSRIRIKDGNLTIGNASIVIVPTSSSSTLTWVSVGVSYYNSTSSVSVFINGLKTQITNVGTWLSNGDDLRIINGPIDNLVIFRTHAIDDLYFAAIDAFYGLPYNHPLPVTFLESETTTVIPISCDSMLCINQ